MEECPWALQVPPSVSPRQSYCWEDVRACIPCALCERRLLQPLRDEPKPRRTRYRRALSTLTLPPQQRVVFDEKEPIQSLLENHYYEPRHVTQPSYDTFIFNPEQCSFTLLQVAEGLQHPVKMKGINALLSLAKRLHIQTPKLRFVVVVFEGLATDFVAPMERGSDMKMSSLEVTEVATLWLS